MSANTNRARQNPRKRAHDDASYISTNPNQIHKKQQNQTSGVVSMDSEPRAAKRKRMVTSQTDLSGLQQRGGSSLIDFTSFPSPFIHHYLNHFDLVPLIRPIPTSTEHPPPPYTLLNPHQYQYPYQYQYQNPYQHIHPPSSRLSRSTASAQIPIPTRTPILADVAELHGVLATLVERHFINSMYTGGGGGGGGVGDDSSKGISGREEVDTLVAFMCAVENGQRGPGMPR
ncbi:hypothetical protein E1B28_001881 [Marasmius oreades]|uniref:Uncharacterized protein n=1 Tax=Marasmius oreades TaxID=181124 RepID=A0A9P7V4B1_9AGAR|nr:uncharacterized protein E1B28_001881 [Marasmius oreades]KAG7100101.1 hypothetical protein E1B28_001881 [Marasmius oreades]